MKDMKEADACHLHVGVIACKPGRWNGGRRPTLPRLPRPSRGGAGAVGNLQVARTDAEGTRCARVHVVHDILTGRPEPV